MTEFSDDDPLYLDDLHVGQRFTSGTHVASMGQQLAQKWCMRRIANGRVPHTG